MHKCHWCPYVTDSIKSLGYHLTGTHLGAATFQGAPHKLKEVTSGQPTGEGVVMCWCGGLYEVSWFGPHLEARGGLDAHIMEIVLGYKWEPKH